MTNTNEELIARAEELAARAMPGPWENEFWIKGRVRLSSAYCWVADALDDYQAARDADFIAASRELVPALAAALERAERQNKAFRELAEDGTCRMLDQYANDIQKYDDIAEKALEDLTTVSAERDRLREENARLRQKANEDPLVAPDGLPRPCPRCGDRGWACRRIDQMATCPRTARAALNPEPKP